MSALGHKRTSWLADGMSALPPKADIGTQSRDVRFVPKADICGAAKFRLFDHLVGGREHSLWDCKTERFGRFQVDD